MHCSECHDVNDFGYFFRYLHQNSNEHEFCSHGWCVSCYKQLRRYLEFRKLKYHCPFCRRLVREALYCNPKDAIEGGRLNPIQINDEVDDAL